MNAPGAPHTHRLRRHARRACLPALLILICTPHRAAADTLILRNGNRIEGEILDEQDKKIILALPGGRIEVPRRQVKEILRTDPVANLLFQGRRLLYHRRFEQALEQFQKAAALAPGATQVHAQLHEARIAYARDLEAAGRHEEAAQFLGHVLAAAPDHGEAREALDAIARVIAAYAPALDDARHALMRNDLPAAEALFKHLWATYPGKHPELAPLYAAALCLLGDAALRADDTAAASAHYERALAIHPDVFPDITRRYTYTQIKTAQGLLDAGQLDAAEALLARAITWCPDSEAIHYLLARTLDLQGRMPEAIEHYTRINPDPGTPFEPDSALARERDGARREASGSRRAAAAPAQGDRLVRVVSANFEVHAPDRDLARRASEALEYHLRRLGPAFGVKSLPLKCAVYLHASKAHYLQAVGARPWSTGYTTWSTRLGQLLFHRIDAFQDCPQMFASVLPHELTHILTGVACAWRSDLPLWAKEGLAVMNEPGFKHRYYQGVLADAARRNCLLPLRTLCAVQDYPDAEEDADLFYAQSHSLTAMLVARAGMKRFLSFITQAGAEPDDALLRKDFKVASMGVLENLWLRANVPER